MTPEQHADNISKLTSRDDVINYIRAIEAAAVAAEREACAKVAEDYFTSGLTGRDAADEIAAAIRARASSTKGDDTMTQTQYVYGWYHYADATDVEFRYPEDKEESLKQDGKTVTVEIKQGGKWQARRGTVKWAGGNYTVIPR